MCWVWWRPIPGKPAKCAVVPGGPGFVQSWVPALVVGLGFLVDEVVELWVFLEVVGDEGADDVDL